MNMSNAKMNKRVVLTKDISSSNGKKKSLTKGAIGYIVEFDRKLGFLKCRFYPDNIELTLTAKDVDIHK